MESSGLRDASFILACRLMYLLVRTREAVNLGDFHQKPNGKEKYEDMMQQCVMAGYKVGG